MALSGAFGSHSAAGRGHYWRTLDSSVFRRRSHHLSVLGRIIPLINLRANLVRVVCFSPVFDGFSCLVWDEHGSMVLWKICSQDVVHPTQLAQEKHWQIHGLAEHLAPQNGHFHVENCCVHNIFGWKS